MVDLRYGWWGLCHGLGRQEVGEEREEPNVMLRIYNFICLNGSNSVTTKIKLKIKE